MSGSAVFGSLARASLGETVTVREARPINGKIHIFIDPPKDASGFVVLYRFDQFPTDISDVKTVRKYIPIKQYQLTSSLVLDTMDERKYYLSVFAEFKRDGEKDYSFGADYLFDNSPPHKHYLFYCRKQKNLRRQQCAAGVYRRGAGV